MDVHAGPDPQLSTTGEARLLEHADIDGAFVTSHGERVRQEMMTPLEALLREAETRPNHVAVIADGTIWSYWRLVMEIERAARAMAARGVGPGDRVALHMANVPEMAIACYACFRIGAIAAPLNNRFKTVELQSLLQRLQPALYLG